MLSYSLKGSPSSDHIPRDKNVGLPIFIRLNKKFKTIGFDNNKLRVGQLSDKKDFNKEFTSKDLKLKNGSFFSSRYNELNKFNFFT